MDSDKEGALAAARIHSRATLLAALLGCIGLIVAALIGSAVGKSQAREQSKDALVAKDEEIARLNGQVKQLTKENDALKLRGAPRENNTDTVGGVVSDDEESIYSSNAKGQSQEQGFTIKFYGCRRGSSGVKCYFDVTNTKAERKFQLTGYPDDARYSRAYDDHGQQHTANTTEVSGSSDVVTIPDGLTVRASIVFKTVPSSVHRFADLKFVFAYAYELYSVDFRDISLT